MKQWYNEIMEHIQVTDEMRARILQSVQQADLSPKKKSIPYQNILKMTAAMAACAAIFVAGRGVLLGKGSASGAPMMSAAEAGDEMSAQESKEESTQIVNGMAECPDAESLEQEVGFSVPQLKTLPFAADAVVYTSYWGEMAEVQYTGGTESICLRKAPGEESVSGDYNEYAAVQQAEIGDAKAVLKGSQEGSYQLAEWQKDGYSYSLQTSEEFPLEWWESAMKEIE